MVGGGGDRSASSGRSCIYHGYGEDARDPTVTDRGSNDRNPCSDSAWPWCRHWHAQGWVCWQRCSRDCISTLMFGMGWKDSHATLEESTEIRDIKMAQEGAPLPAESVRPNFGMAPALEAPPKWLEMRAEAAPVDTPAGCVECAVPVDIPQVADRGKVDNVHNIHPMWEDTFILVADCREHRGENPVLLATKLPARPSLGRPKMRGIMRAANASTTATAAAAGTATSPPTSSRRRRGLWPRRRPGRRSADALDRQAWLTTSFRSMCS